MNELVGPRVFEAIDEKMSVPERRNASAASHASYNAKATKLPANDETGCFHHCHRVSNGAFDRPLPGEDAQPTLAGDVSCHNPFAPGASRVSAVLQMDVKISNDEWDLLKEILQSFAEDEGWSLRDTSMSNASVVKTLEISACRPAGLAVFVNEQRWAANDYAPLPGLGVMVRLYGAIPRESWEPAAKRLFDLLQARLPGKIRFMDGGGFETDPPAWAARVSRSRRAQLGKGFDHWLAKAAVKALRAVDWAY